MVVNSRLALTKLQSIVEEREPFNNRVIFFREDEDIERMFSDVFKGLEVVSGVEFVSCSVENFKHVYEEKKTDLTDKEKLKLENMTKWSKGANKSMNSPYPLVNTKQSRLMSVKVRMRFSDDKATEEKDYEFYYPELIDGQYFYLSGNKFFPVYQLADAEYYQTGRSSIVLKTTFMPISIRGLKTDFTDSDETISYKARTLEVTIFKKNINAFIYFYNKFGVNDTLKFFSLDEHVEIVFESEDALEKDLDTYYYFKINGNMTILVERLWFDGNPGVNSSIINTLVSSFRKKHLDKSNFYDPEYWNRQLGKNFTTNSSKTLEKSQSITLSLERLLDNITKSYLRNDPNEKETVYHMLRTMMYQFENIIRIDNYDLANKRIRLNEYLLSPFIKRLSTSVYRMIGSKSPTVSKKKQLFSSIEPDFIVKQILSIDLVRYSNSVNTLDLFNHFLKGSKSGPQSQNTDSGSPSTGIRGIDNSYIGRLDVTSTSSNDPGISFTVTPFCDVCDPNGNSNFFFTDKPNVKDFNSINSADDDLIEIEDIIEEE